MLKSRSGLSILEVIIVVALVVVIATLAYVSTKPTKRLGEAADVQRQYDVESIEKAIKLVATDSGSLSSALTGLTDNTPYMIVKAGGSTAGAYTCTATGTDIAKADISGAIASIMPNLPVDPDLAEASNDTGYYLVKNGNSYNIESCDSYYLAATIGDKQSCGDGYCGSTESCSSCTVDCGACVPASVCGNSLVEGTEACDDGDVVTEGCLNGLLETAGTYCNATCSAEVVIAVSETCDSLGTGGCYDEPTYTQYFDLTKSIKACGAWNFCSSDCSVCVPGCLEGM